MQVNDISKCIFGICVQPHARAAAVTAARLWSACFSVRRHVVYDHTAGDSGVDDRKPAGNLVADGGAGEPTGTRRFGRRPDRRPRRRRASTYGPTPRYGRRPTMTCLTSNYGPGQTSIDLMATTAPRQPSRALAARHSASQRRLPIGEMYGGDTCKS